MNVFNFRNRIIEDYSGYVSSFISIAQSRLRDFVDGCFKSGSLWPDPLIQLNPTFKPGKTVAELVQEGVLATGCAKVFRRDKTEAVGSGEDLLFHQHQEDAIRKAKEGRNYVLTTGTGSGKSLSYIVPIVDHVLRAGSGRGIQAIIIYPMNALANSQFGELEKFLKLGFADGKGPVTFERYTGQEDEETRTRIIATPPDILLTNYVMLELILTRPREKKLIASAKGLKFLVLDELHTYRGRQGADVALLLRRVRELLNADAMQCVGTSATLAGRGSWEEQCADVAKLATRLFGDTVEGADIIGETLERATAPIDETNPTDVAALSAVLAPNARHLPETFDQLAADPVARWVEGTFGIVPLAGRLVRSPSIPLTGKHGAAERLAKLTGASTERCKEVVAETLLAGATRILGDLSGFTVEVLISGILWLVGEFASLLVFWAYIIQKFILFSSYALSPLLIGFMAIRPLRSVGGRYLMNIVGVLLWPLGWAVAALITQGILDFMTDPSFKFIDPTATLYSLQATVGVVVVAFWIVFSTIAAPLAIQKVIASGALAGGQLLAGAASSFLQTAATTAGAAAVASTTGVPFATVGAAGMAAVLSTLSTAGGHGSAGAIIIAGSGLPPRSARGRPGDDITGDKSVRELIAKGKGNYY